MCIVRVVVNEYHQGTFTSVNVSTVYLFADFITTCAARGRVIALSVCPHQNEQASL